MKDQNFTDLLIDGQQLWQDLSEQERKLIYWAITLDDEARSALVMAYRLIYDSESGANYSINPSFLDLPAVAKCE
jgi:hypothetical protein